MNISIKGKQRIILLLSNTIHTKGYREQYSTRYTAFFLSLCICAQLSTPVAQQHIDSIEAQGYRVAGVCAVAYAATSYQNIQRATCKQSLLALNSYAIQLYTHSIHTTHIHHTYQHTLYTSYRPVDSVYTMISTMLCKLTRSPTANDRCIQVLVQGKHI